MPCYPNGWPAPGSFANHDSFWARDVPKVQHTSKALSFISCPSKLRKSNYSSPAPPNNETSLFAILSMKTSHHAQNLLRSDLLHQSEQPLRHISIYLWKRKTGPCLSHVFRCIRRIPRLRQFCPQHTCRDVPSLQNVATQAQRFF